MAAPYFGVQAGIGALGGSSTDGSVIFVPLGARYYFIPKIGSPFVTGGFVYASASSGSGPFDDDSESTTYSYAGLGFEVRSLSGFVFRGTAYALISGGEYFIWPGINIGYAW